MGDRQSGVAPFRRYPLTVQVASPAAGADWSIVVPAGRLWDVLAVSAQLVTSATVATRVAQLTVSDGDVRWITVEPAASQAASLTRLYSWWENAAGLAVGSGIVQGVPRLRLSPGAVVASSTAAIDTTDQWSAVVLRVVETMFTAGPIDIAEVPELVVQLAGQMG